MIAAPLISGNDLRSMSKETLNILTNKDVIAVDQDSLGVQGLKFFAKDSPEVWFNPLEQGDWAMCVLNRCLSSQKVIFNWKTEAVSDSVSGRNTEFTNTVYRLKDLWTKKDLGTTNNALNRTVPGRDLLMMRLSKM